MVGTDLFQYQCPPAARKNMTASCSRWRDGIAVASRVVRKWYSKFRKSELRKSVINGKSDVSVVQSVQVHFIDYSANVNTRWFGISPRGTWCTWSLDMSSEQIWFFCAVHIIFAIDTLNNLLMREQKPQSTTVTGGDHIFGINIRSCIPRYTSHLKLPPLPGILPLWVANSAASLRARWWTWEVNGVESVNKEHFRFSTAGLENFIIRNSFYVSRMRKKRRKRSRWFDVRVVSSRAIAGLLRVSFFVDIHCAEHLFEIRCSCCLSGLCYRLVV